MSTLSSNLKYYRELSGLTSREVSEKTGIPQMTYIGWETGHRQPRNLDENLDKIATVFGITKDILLYDRTEEPITIEQKEKRADQHRQAILHAYDSLTDEARARLLRYAEDLLANNRNKR